MRIWFTLLILLLSIGAGCTTLIPGQIVESSAPLQGRTYNTIGPADGEGCSTYVLFPFIRFGDDSLNAVLTEVIKEKQADALIAITTDIRATSYPFVGKKCLKVRGTAIRFNKE